MHKTYCQQMHGGLILRLHTIVTVGKKEVIHRDNCQQLLQELNREQTADILSWNAFTMIEYIYVWVDEQRWVIDTGEEMLELRQLDCTLNSLNN